MMLVDPEIRKINNFIIQKNANMVVEGLFTPFLKISIGKKITDNSFVFGTSSFGMTMY